MTDRKLQIQVALGAVNNLTRPLNAAQKSSAALASQIKSTRDTIKQLSSQASSFDRLTESSRKTADQVAAAQMKTHQMASALRMLENPTQKQIAAVQKQNAELAKLQGRQRDEIQQLNRLKAGFYQQGISISRSSAATAQITSHTERLNRQLQEQEQRLKRVGAAREKYDKGQALRGKLAGAGAAATAAGAGILYGSGRLLSPGVDFSESMSRVQALTRLDSGSSDLGMLRTEARKLGAVTAFSATDAAQGQQMLAMAGFTPEAIKNALPGVLNMALAGGVDLGTTADIGSNILSQFGMRSEEMDRISDSLVGTFTRTNTNLQELGEAMVYVGPLASNLSIDFETTAAMAGKLADNGIKGSMAGTALRASLARMSSPAGNAKKAMDELGVSYADAAGKARNPIDVMEEIQRKLSQYAQVDQISFLKDIAGEEAFVALQGLLKNAGEGTLRELSRTIHATQGEADKNAKIMASNLRGDLRELSSAWEELRIEMEESVDSPLRTLTQGAAKALGVVSDWAKRHPKMTKLIVVSVLAIGMLSAALGGLMLAAAALLGPLLALRLGVGLLAGNSVRAALSTGILSRALTGLRTLGAGVFSAPLNGVRALGRGLTWLVSSPLKTFGGAAGWVLRGVGVLLTGLSWPVVAVGAALTAAALIVRKYWEPIKAWFSGFFSGFIEQTRSLRESFAPLGVIFSDLGRGLSVVWGWLQSVWDWFTRLLAPVNSTREELDKATQAGRNFGAILGQAVLDLWAPFDWLNKQITWVLEKLSLIPDQAERIRIAAAQGNAMNNAMPDGSHSPKAAVMHVWDPKLKRMTAAPWSEFVGPADGPTPAASSPALPSAPTGIKRRMGSGSPASGSAISKSPAVAAVEKRDPNKLGDIVFKNVAPHIALASPYLTAQREQAKAITGLSKAAEALRKSTTGLDKFGSIGLGQGAAGFAGIFAEPQKQQTSVFNQLRAIASGVLQRAQDWIGGGPQLAFAGPGAVLAPQANQRTLLARPAPAMVEGNTYHLSFDLKEAGQLDERKIAMLVKEQITDIERQKAMRNRSQLRDRE